MLHQPDPALRPLDHLAELAGAAGRGDRPALVLREGTLNHNQLRQRVGQIAMWLIDMLPQPGARVASWAAKGELTCLLPLAAARAGLVHVPINPLLKRAQVAHILGDSGAELLIGTPSRLASLEPGDLPEACFALGEDEALRLADGFGSLGPSAIPLGTSSNPLHLRFDRSPERRDAQPCQYVARRGERGALSRAGRG